MVWIVATVVFIVSIIAATMIFEDIIQRVMAYLLCLALYVVATASSAVVIVAPGSVAIPIWFGTVQHSGYEEGIQFINPMASTAMMDIRRDTIDFSNDRSVGSLDNPVNGPSILAISKDQNHLTIDISVPYAISPRFAWKLYQKIGRTDSVIEAKLLETNVRTSVLDVVYQYPWVDVATNKRQDVVNEIGARLKARIESDLVSSGFTAEEAKAAFIFSEPQLRQVSPDASVLASVAEKTAQEQVNQTAVLQIERKRAEGAAIAAVLNGLPKDIKASDVANILKAMAARDHATAVLEAVKGDKIRIMVIPGGSPVAVTPE